MLIVALAALVVPGYLLARALQVPAAPAAASPGGKGPYQATFPVSPGRLDAAIEVRAVDGALLDRWTEVAPVPDPAAPLALSRPRLVRALHAPGQPFPAAAADTVYLASRSLRRGDRVAVQFDVYAAAGSSPALAIELLNQGGVVLGLLPARPLGGSTYRAELPLVSLAPGTFLLRIRATSADRTATEALAFKVMN